MNTEGTSERNPLAQMILYVGVFVFFGLVVTAIVFSIFVAPPPKTEATSADAVILSTTRHILPGDALQPQGLAGPWGYAINTAKNTAMLLTFCNKDNLINFTLEGKIFPTNQACWAKWDPQKLKETLLEFQKSFDKKSSGYQLLEFFIVSLP